MNNVYTGRKAALWMLGAILLFKGLMGLMCILRGYAVAMRTDGIPLHTFSPEATQTVLAFLALWGWSLLLFCLLGALALWRLRGAVPLVFMTLLAEQLGRTLILNFIPMTHAGGAAVSIKTLLLAWMFTGLALSVWPNKIAKTSGAQT